MDGSSTHIICDSQNNNFSGHILLVFVNDSPTFMPANHQLEATRSPGTRLRAQLWCGLAPPQGTHMEGEKNWKQEVTLTPCEAV
jgi:hypothetical protein